MRILTKHAIGIATAIAVTSCAASGCSTGSSSATPAASTSSRTATKPPSTSSTLATSQWPTTANGVPTAGGTNTPAMPAQRAHSAPGPAVQTRVKTFVTAVVSTKGVSRSAWAAKLSSFVNPDLAQRLALTDPANIPPQKVTGKPQLLYVSTTEAVSGWFVPTSATGYTVTMSQGGGKLQIVAVEPGRIAPTTAVPTDNG